MQKNNIQKYMFDFIKIAKYSLWASLIITIIAIGTLFTKGFVWGVDFAGGNQLRVFFNEKVHVDRNQLETLLEPLKINPSITQIDNTQGYEFFIYYSAENKSYSDNIKTIFNKEYNNNWSILSENFVGSKIGQQFRKTAIVSTIIILLLILVYIAFRFDFRFGIAAVISLLHDILIVLCFISLAQISFTIPTLAAILTVVGYSLNDTIVIFDRIRSERKLLEKDLLSNIEYYGLVNLSIQKSMIRTLLTGGTTLAVLLILYFVGGLELKPMAMILFVGVIIGTVSSNFVAPPVLYLWNKKDNQKS